MAEHLVPKKPGYLTTEFWLVFAAVLVGGLLASGVIQEDTSLHQMVVFIASSLAALGYAGVRTWTKTTDRKAEALVAANSINGADGPSGNG